MITHQDANQIDRFVGAVRIVLPRRLQMKLHDVFKEEFSALPHETAAAIESNILGAIGLIMRAANVERIYEAERARQNYQAATDAAVREHMATEQVKQHHLDAVHDFECVVFHRHATGEQLADAAFEFMSYLDANVLDLRESTILKTWAGRMIVKRKELTR